MLAKQGGGSQRFGCRHVAAAGHHHIGLDSLIVAGPTPDADTLCAVRDRRLHVQKLDVLFLVRDDNVDVVHATQTVVCNRQERVGIGRQIDAHRLGALVCHNIQKSRILVSETIMVLPPYQAGD